MRAGPAVLLAAMPPVPDQAHDEGAQEEEGQNQSWDAGRRHDGYPAGEQAHGDRVLAISFRFRRAAGHRGVRRRDARRRPRPGGEGSMMAGRSGDGPGLEWLDLCARKSGGDSGDTRARIDPADGGQRRPRSLPNSRCAWARRRGSAAARRISSAVRCPWGLLANCLRRSTIPGMTILPVRGDGLPAWPVYPGIARSGPSRRCRRRRLRRGGGAPELRVTGRAPILRTAELPCRLPLVLLL